MEFPIHSYSIDPGVGIISDRKKVNSGHRDAVAIAQAGDNLFVLEIRLFKHSDED